MVFVRVAWMLFRRRVTSISPHTHHYIQHIVFLLSLQTTSIRKYLQHPGLIFTLKNLKTPNPYYSIRTLRDSPKRFLTYSFFQNSNPPGPLTNGLKYFRFWLRICKLFEFLYLPGVRYNPGE